MSRIRTIKPEFWSSKTLARVSRDSRLTFIGLWGMCDDLGVMLDAPKTIAGELFPHDDDVGTAEINIYLTELVDIDVIRRVSENGKDFIIITHWDEHQKIDRPSKHCWISRETRDSLASVSRQSRAITSLGKGKGTEEKEKEQKESSSLRSDSYGPTKAGEIFDSQFWPNFPKRTGNNPRGKARDKFIAVVTKNRVNPLAIVAGASAYATFTKASDPRFVQMAVTWLNQRGWEEDYTAMAQGPPAATGLMDWFVNGGSAGDDDGKRCEGSVDDVVDLAREDWRTS